MHLSSAFGKTAILVCMVACGPAFLKQPQVEIEVIKATSQEWIAGAPGGGKGVNYKFDIRILTDKKVEVDSVWVSGKQLQIIPEKASAAKAAKNSVVVFTASTFTGGPGRGLQKTEEPVNEATNNATTLPMAQKEAAVMRYRVDGISKVLKIDSFTVLPAVYGQ